MGTPISRRRVLVGFATGFAACGGAGLLSACTGSAGPARPTPAPSAAPDPLFAILDGHERLLAQYDAAARQQPELLTRLSSLRAQTEAQVVTLRLALALPEPTSAAPGSTVSASSTASGSSSAVPVEAPVTLQTLRASVRVVGAAAATLCETTTVQRAPLLGSLAAAASCHDLMLG